MDKSNSAAKQAANDALTRYKATQVRFNKGQESNGNGTALRVKPVDLEVDVRTSSFGQEIEMLVLTYEEDAPNRIVNRKRTKAAAHFSDEAKLIASLEYGQTYVITRGLGDDGFVRWETAALAA